MRARIGAVALVLLACGEAPAIERLAWLTGCWELRGKTRVVEEHWTAPRGDTILGLSRTVAGSKTVAWEYLRIEQRDGRLFLIARPSGQEEAEFAQIALDDWSVTFENPDHDFPQRIGYRLQEDGSIVGRIEGGSGESLRVVEFPMLRVPCE